MYKFNTGTQCAPLCQVDVARNVKARVSGEMDEEQAVETTSQGALVPVLVPCRGDSLDHSPTYLFGSTFLSYLTKSSLTDSHPPVPYCHGYVDSRWNHSHISLITSTYLPWEYVLRANVFGIVPTLACKYNVSGPTKDYQPILIQLTIYLSLTVLQT